MNYSWTRFFPLLNLYAFKSRQIQQLEKKKAEENKDDCFRIECQDLYIPRAESGGVSDEGEAVPVESGARGDSILITRRMYQFLRIKRMYQS